MKKNILFNVMALLIVFGVNAQNAEQEPVNPNAPVLSIDKLVYDYGTIYQHADGNGYFVYTNTGKEPLIFSRVKSSCGCTVPKWSRQPLLPGQSDTLKVRYDTKKIGSFHKAITITSNATEDRVVIKVKGKVIPEPSEGMPLKNVDNEMSPVNK